MKITRKFANPSADTFDVPVIGEFVKSYLRNSKVSIDPFARNKRWATYTNDLNPVTGAEYHLPALDFLKELCRKGIKADLVIFDPPYTRRQVKEVYEGIGLGFTNNDSQYFSLNWKDEREIINEILTIDGIVLSFGYHSNGMRFSGAYTDEEMLVVCHGGAHYDTICIAQRKVAYQPALLEVA